MASERLIIIYFESNSGPGITIMVMNGHDTSNCKDSLLDGHMFRQQVLQVSRRRAATAKHSAPMGRVGQTL